MSRTVPDRDLTRARRNVEASDGGPAPCDLGGAVGATKGEMFPVAIMQQWPGVLFRQRPDLTFEFASPRLEEMTGHPLEEWRSQPGLLWEVVHELDVDELRQRLSREWDSCESSTVEFRLRHAGTGHVTYIREHRQARCDAAGCLLGYEGFWMDITRQTLAERRLGTAAWKETVGLVTLGLAHDFNNVLAGILGLSESFLSQIQPDHPFHEGLVLVKKSTQQAAQLIQRIGELNRGKTGTRSYQDLNQLVRVGVDLLRTVVPRRIELQSVVESSELPLYVDAVEFQQVLIHLAINASEAMPERGTISVRAVRSESPASSQHQVGALPPGPTACLEISDTGTGIKPRLLPYIFDPFFTTKPMNRGAGLGLYNARLFAEKHQGAISVESGEGAGATFRVWLPLADFTEADRALELSNQRRRSILLAGNPGRQMDGTADFLRQNSYHVVKGGADPEDLLRSSDYQFDGVMLLVEPEDRLALPLARLVRQQKLPIRIIVKTVGCNPDELDPQLFSKADLIVSAEMAADNILDRLAAMFDVRTVP